MNDFLNKLSAVAKRTADTVSTTVNVAAEEQKIKEAYQAVGKLYYQANRNHTEVDNLAVADQFRAIDECMKRIEQLKDKKDVTGETAEAVADDDDFVTVE